VFQRVGVAVGVVMSMIVMLCMVVRVRMGIVSGAQQV
jgi:hypothetical protein